METELLLLEVKSAFANALIGNLYKPTNASFVNDLESQIFVLIQNFSNFIYNLDDFNCNLNIRNFET